MSFYEHLYINKLYFSKENITWKKNFQPPFFFSFLQVLFSSVTAAFQFVFSY